MKEEQEELCTSQEGEVLAVKLEADSLMATPISEEADQSEAEPVNEQQDEEGSQHVDSGSAEEEEPRTKKRRLTHRSHSNRDDHCLTSEIHDEDKTDLAQLDDEREPPRPVVSSSPSPAPSLSSSCSSSSFHQTRSGKQKRNTNMDLLDYLERSGGRSRREEQLTSALLQSIQKMEDCTNTLVGLMGRIVSA
ncbi:uncharacterized protein KZ484_025422 [Pholidichthys leucotaenia]